MNRLPFEKEEEVTELPFERKKKKEELGVGKRILGGAAATVDFIGDMVPDAIAGVGGLAKGAYDAATTDKSFVDASADSIRKLQENLESMRGGMGKFTGTFDTDAYRTAQEALATPAAAGTMAVRGLGALGRLPFGGVEGAVQGLEEPWRNPITSAFSDAAGPLLGYPIAGRAGKVIGDNTVQVKPFQRPEPVAEPLPPKSRLVDPEEVRREGMDVVEEGKLNPYDQGGELVKGIDLELHQRDADAMAARWKEQRLKDEMDAERQRPLDFGLELEPNPLREEARLTDNDRITRGREEFPTMDIDLLPERVSRDTVVKGLITKWNNEQARLRELYQQANETGLEGTRVRAGELGTTKKSKAQINKLREDIATIEKKLENLSKQLQRRMEVKHNFTYDEGWTGAPLYSGAETRLKLDSEGRVMFGEQEVFKSKGGKAVKEKVEVPLEETDIGVYSEYPPSIKGPAERTTGLTVEKTERGNMQRSPDANITGAEMVEKTKAHPLGGVGKRQGGAIDTSVFTEGLGKLFGKAKKSIPSRPAPKPTAPITRYMLEDTRNLDQFWKEESPSAGEWKDLSDSLFQKIVQGKFVASMARNLNPVAQYLTSKVVSLDRMANVAKENALWGTKFVDNLRGWSKRVKSDDGALTFFESGKAKEVAQVHETLLKYDDADVLKAQGLERPTEQMLRADGLNDAQVKAVNAVYDQIGKLFDEVNKRLTAAGKDTMKKIPGYIPHMWFGDYRVALKDAKTGEILDIRGANNKKEAASIAAEMQKRFPDRKVETFDAHRNRYKMDDVSAFQYALQMLQKGTPEHTIMNKVYKDIVAHRGFKTHALQRKGAKGFAGSEVSRTGTKDFTKAMEAYFNQGYNFIANMEKKKVYAELKKKLDEGKVDLPNTRKFVDEYVSHSTGGMESKLQFIDELIQGAGERAGMGPGAIKRGIQNMNALASFFFLTSGKFLAANTVQPLYNWAKLRNIALDFDAPGATRTMAKAYMETFLGQTSAKTKQGLSWAKQNGYIDAKTIELMNTKLNKVNAVNAFVYKGSKHSLGWWEQEVVRTPTFVMYDLALRDVIKNDKERWETAGALTDKYMVDYGKSESPFFYEQMGTVGEATRPLKQYGHAYAGQLGEYVKLATEDKQYSPLVGFLASQITVSGLKGLPLVGTAAALINVLNNSFGTTFQTPEEALLGSGLSSAWVFGPISTETGIDISGSVSAPGVEDIWGMPGLSFAGSALGAGAEFAGKMGRGTVTDMDVMKTIPKVMPNPHVQALTEKAFSEDGVVPDPNNRGLPRLSNPRTPMEEAVRIGTGAQLTREQEEKAVANAFKRDNQRSSKVKKEVMDKIVNDFVRKDDLDPAIIDRYMEAGGDPNNIISEIEGHMRNMLFSQLEREVLNSTGMSQMQKIEKLKEYRQILEDAGAEDLVELLKD